MKFLSHTYSEKELVEGCKKGKAKFQEMLYKQFSGKMFTVSCRYIQDKDQAKDVHQDAFVKIFLHISRFNLEGSLEGWIRRIVVNTALSYLKKEDKLSMERLNDRLSETEEDATEEEIGVLSILGEEELLNLVRTLPPDYRMVFNMAVFEEMSFKEIAEKFDSNESTCRSKLLRARKMLQKTILETYQKKTLAQTY